MKRYAREAVRNIGGLLLPDSQEENNKGGLPFSPNIIITSLITVGIGSIFSAFWLVNTQISNLRVQLAKIEAQSNENHKRVIRLENNLLTADASTTPKRCPNNGSTN